LRNRDGAGGPFLREVWRSSRVRWNGVLLRRQSKSGPSGIWASRGSNPILPWAAGGC